MENVLDIYIDLVEQYNAEIGVTINAGGLLVFGTMISTRAYLDEVIREFGDAVPQNEHGAALIEGVTSGIHRVIEQIDSEAHKRNKTEELAIAQSNYINLRDVTVALSQPCRLPSWRVPLASIHGFCLGQPKRD